MVEKQASSEIAQSLERFEKLAEFYDGESMRNCVHRGEEIAKMLRRVLGERTIAESQPEPEFIAIFKRDHKKHCSFAGQNAPCKCPWKCLSCGANTDCSEEEVSPPSPLEDQDFEGFIPEEPSCSRPECKAMRGDTRELKAALEKARTRFFYISNLSKNAWRDPENIALICERINAYAEQGKDDLEKLLG